MNQAQSSRFAAFCWLLAAAGWVAALVLYLVALPGAGWQAGLAGRAGEFQAWLAGNGSLWAALWWVLAASFLLAAAAMIGTAVRLRPFTPDLVAWSLPAGLTASIVIAAVSLARAGGDPMLATASAGPLLDWSRAVTGAWLALLGIGLLAAWTFLTTLAILRSGQMSRPLGWVGLLVALCQLVLALGVQATGLGPRGAGWPALVLTPLWALWLARHLWRPADLAEQRWIRGSEREQWDQPGASRGLAGMTAEERAPLAPWQRAVIAVWRFFLTIWMVWLKRPFSRLVNATRPGVTWQKLEFESLEQYAQWLPEHARWVADPLGGAFDFFPKLAYTTWQLIKRGEVTDDCDGLAYFSCANIEPFCDAPAERFLVTVLIDPFDVGWPNSAHVMLFFRSEGKWRVISNQYLYEPRWDSFLDALVQNRYVGGRQVLMAAVQDADLRTLWWGKPGPNDGRPASLQ